MDARRVNDLLKVVGTALATASASLTTFVPYLTGRPLAIVLGVASVLGMLGGAFVAGLGTRAVGTEYQAIADAKAIAVAASLVPPPIPPVPKAPTRAVGP